MRVYTSDVIFSPPICVCVKRRSNVGRSFRPFITLPPFAGGSDAAASGEGLPQWSIRGADILHPEPSAFRSDLDLSVIDSRSRKKF